MNKSIVSVVFLWVFLTVFSPLTFCQEVPVASGTNDIAGNVVADEVEEYEILTTQGVFVQKVKESGKTGIALLLISIAGFACAFERLFNLRKANIVPSGIASKSNKLWKEGKYDEIEALVDANPSTLSRIIRLMVEHRNGGHADVSNLAGDVASRELRVHMQRAYPLAIVATVSPLLGLFGTVYGMIGAFESVALAGKMGDPSVMASDISFALITTALGLVIAVPALICFHFFKIRTNILGLALEEQVNHLIIRWFPIDSKSK
ncbi:MAG: MotA/TolQ/ExbB proton channel family protein [Kiritimatiellae bacterium]|jgi:biopolymer transport protein ExbB|nr:MotA/TolQ/ExbB proton channel family protein [Kiritimatiellia bacterium]